MFAVMLSERYAAVFPSSANKTCLDRTWYGEGCIACVLCTDCMRYTQPEWFGLSALLILQSVSWKQQQPHGVIQHCTIKKSCYWYFFAFVLFFKFESIHCVILASAGTFPTMPTFIYLNSIKRHLSEFKCSEHSLSKGLRSFMYLVSRINITLSNDNDSSQGGPPARVKLKVNISSVFVRF